MPMSKSIYYPTSKYQKSKSVLQSSSYYSTIYATVSSLDSADLNPQSNHQLQSSSLQFNPNLEYKLIFLHYKGFDRTSVDSMVIEISKLDSDAQIILPFKKGNFKLSKMKTFQKLKKNDPPIFKINDSPQFKNTLKLDSTAFFNNGKLKTKYFILYPNFPLYFVQEFDSISDNFSQGFRLMQNYNQPSIGSMQSIWANNDYSKYGYWEYFENGSRTKHEMWASILQESYEWYNSTQIKSITHYGQANKETKHLYYLENGSIREEFYIQTKFAASLIKEYLYSEEGALLLVNTYKSSNGIIKEELLKRELYYPSGKVKMIEAYLGTYSIKYFNENGTKKND
jgi:hypothetical protein